MTEMPENMDDLRELIPLLDPMQLDDLIERLPSGVVEQLVDELGMRRQYTVLPTTPLEQAQEIMPEFVVRDHLRYLSNRLTAAVKSVENGGNPRIIVEMPPRSGKSLLATQVMSGWTLATHPKWHIVMASYSSQLAITWSRQVRRWAQAGMLGDLKVSPDAGAAAHWNTTEGGQLMGRSLNEGITGFGAKLLVIDDPHKDFADAHSAASREAVWNWWLSTSSSRLTPQSIVLVIMCMTGDTPVLRPDGTETPLRDIRPGDEIATYENGGLTTSRVLNWANQGPDDVFSIRLESGRVVRANARHPFLTVDENGVEAWQRTDQLRPGSSILTATGASGEASSAKSLAAPSRSVARESAGRTTTSVDGPRDTDPPQLTPRLDELRGSSTATASPRRNTMRWSPDSEDSARSAENPRQTARLTGAASSASTTITSPVESESFSATTATSLSSGTSRLNDSEPPLSTWSVTPDRVVSIEPAGREDVFDLQVERTENFIANGLVSHNTRWHEDDLVGRLLSREYPGDPDEWEVIRFPAIAEDNDILGRKPGEPLLSPLDPNEDIPAALERWERVKRTVGSYVWSALYQQRPSPSTGAMLQLDWFRYWTTDPELADPLLPDGTVDPNAKTVLLDPHTLAGGSWVDSWDMSFKGEENSDYTVGQRWVKHRANRYLVAQVRDRMAFPQVLAQMRTWAGRDPATSPYGQYVHTRLVEDSANGPATISTLKGEIAGLKPVTARYSKEQRVRSVTPEIESGNVYLPHPATPGFGWVNDLISELREFPNGAHDDQADAMSQALFYLRDAGEGGITMPGEAKRMTGLPQPGSFVAPRGYGKVGGDRVAAAHTMRRL